MLSAEEIADRVAGQIYSVYARPLMHAPHTGVDALLWGYHWVWSSAMECDFEFSEAVTNMYSSRNSEDAAGVLNYPESLDGDGLSNVISCWRAVSDRIGIPGDGPYHPKKP